MFITDYNNAIDLYFVQYEGIWNIWSYGLITYSLSGATSTVNTVMLWVNFEIMIKDRRHIKIPPGKIIPASSDQAELYLT